MRTKSTKIKKSQFSAFNYIKRNKKSTQTELIIIYFRKGTQQQNKFVLNKSHNNKNRSIVYNINKIALKSDSLCVYVQHSIILLKQKII